MEALLIDQDRLFETGYSNAYFSHSAISQTLILTHDSDNGAKMVAWLEDILSRMHLAEVPVQEQGVTTPQSLKQLCKFKQIGKFRRVEISHSKHDLPTVVHPHSIPVQARCGIRSKRWMDFPIKQQQGSRLNGVSDIPILCNILRS